MSETVELLFDVGDESDHPTDDPYRTADELVSALGDEYILVDTYDGRTSRRFIARTDE